MEIIEILLQSDVYYEKMGIKFMTICPGLTKTPMANPGNAIKQYRFPEFLKEIRAAGPAHKYQE